VVPGTCPDPTLKIRNCPAGRGRWHGRRPLWSLGDIVATTGRPGIVKLTHYPTVRRLVIAAPAEPFSHESLDSPKLIGDVG